MKCALTRATGRLRFPAISLMTRLMRVTYGTLMCPTIPQKPDGLGRSSSTVLSGTAARSARRSLNSVAGEENKMSFVPAPHVTRSGRCSPSRGS